jgi:hypothetical protein
MFLHIFYTWLLSNFFHPFVFLLWSMVRNNFADLPGAELFAIGSFFFGISLIISVPCLLVGWLCLYLISVSLNTAVTKYILWLVVGPSLVFFEVLFILLFSNEIDIEILLSSFPAMIAVVVAILIRQRQFEKLSNSTKMVNHETNMV